jgi:hypothetical protein
MTSKSSDPLTETTDQGKIELKEEEMNRVAGGTVGGKATEFLKIKLTDVFVSGDQTGGGSKN